MILSLFRNTSAHFTSPSAFSVLSPPQITGNYFLPLTWSHRSRCETGHVDRCGKLVGSCYHRSRPERIRSQAASSMFKLTSIYRGGSAAHHQHTTEQPSPRRKGLLSRFRFGFTPFLPASGNESRLLMPRIRSTHGVHPERVGTSVPSTSASIIRSHQGDYAILVRFPAPNQDCLELGDFPCHTMEE